MKKVSKITTFVIVLIIAVLTANVAVYAYENNDDVYLNDTADFLTADEEEQLFDFMVTTAEATGWKIGVVSTAEDYSDNGVIRAAENYFDSYFGSSADGVLLLMDSANGNYVLHIVAANGARKYISNSDAIRIFEHIKPSFEAYDEFRTAATFLDDAINYRNGKKLPRQVNIEIAFFFLIAAIAAAAITAGVVWHRYHKHAKISATAYLNKGSINIYNRSDRFVREYTTRTRNSSDSSGGGGHHGGGSHGGGGGRGSR
ncbi:MAG: TPM domain-containing protein [Ruminococcus sp.]|jgi:uncharacterized protein|nr:TPM domain-containing protein [Ruminococcus sp.]